MKTRNEVLFELEDVDLDRAVKIQGTEHDRKRKLNDKQVERLKELVNAGVTYDECALIFKVHPITIKAYVEPAFREKLNGYTRAAWARNHIDYHDYSVKTPMMMLGERAAYKRELIAKSRIGV